MKGILIVSFTILLFTAAATSQTPHNAPTSKAAETKTPAISWVLFDDPAERAFSMQVPQGWKVVGGLYRFGPLDPRGMIDVLSPDGKIDLRFGDSHVPPFAVPTPLGIKLGFREGSPYNPNGMSQSIVAYYRPGWVFADLYGQGRFSPQCRRLNLKSMKQSEPVHPASPPMKVTAGEVVYTCDSSSGPLAAYVFTETQLFEIQGIGNWGVTWLYSFISPQDRAVETMKLMLHALSTFKMNPEWEARQSQINGAATQQAMRTMDQSMAQMRSRYEQQSAQMQSQSESFDRIINGVDLTTDPVDGKQREVWMGTGAPHWINGLDQVVNSPTQPGMGFHKLNTQP